MIDACYPLGKGSRLGNEEIRFSLRSLLANAENLGKIYIVGEKPAFLGFGDRLVHIPYTEHHGAYRNVWEKLRVMAEDDRISEKFLFLNDDFYIVRKFDAGNVPYFSRGGRLKTMTSGGKTLDKLRIADITVSYHRVMKHTLTALEKRGLPTYLFATHQPVNFEKSKVLAVYKEFEKELSAPYGLSFRSCYGNMFHLTPVVRPTYIVKTHWHIPPGRLAFASHKDVDRTMLVRKLSAMFSQKSVFEKA